MRGAQQPFSARAPGGGLGGGLGFLQQRGLVQVLKDAARQQHSTSHHHCVHIGLPGRIDQRSDRVVNRDSFGREGVEQEKSAALPTSREPTRSAIPSAAAPPRVAQSSAAGRGNTRILGCHLLQECAEFEGLQHVLQLLEPEPSVAMPMVTRLLPSPRWGDARAQVHVAHRVVGDGHTVLHKKLDILWRHMYAVDGQKIQTKEACVGEHRDGGAPKTLQGRDIIEG